MALLHISLHPPSPLSFQRSSTTIPALIFSRHSSAKLHQRGIKLAAAALPSESAIADFWRWLRERGTLTQPPPPVRPAVVPEGLGLVAERDMLRNEVVVEVPKKLWINTNTVAASEIGPVTLGLKPWVAIALFLLREKAMGAASLWRPYLDILPPETDSPIFWSEEELSQMRGTQLLNTTFGVKEYVQNEFTKVEDEVILPNKHLFQKTINSSDFLWAFGILRSRAFSGLRGDKLVLIPLADLINHNSSITSEDTCWEIKGKGLFSRELIFSLRTPASVNTGEQIYIQYDLQKSNAELALDYGFIESNNKSRELYTMTLEISESDPFYGDKLDIAESNGLGETAYFDIVLDRPLPPLMLPYLRLVALGGTDAFLLESLFRNTVWGHLELPVSRANEEMICRVIQDSCTSALSYYQTTVEEDEKLMERGGLDPRSEIAIGIRSGEKKVLLQIEQVFGARESELDTLEYYQERRLKDLGLSGEQGEIIFWESK
ncbi:fructose-bisphosphate aldolase-lysine N-methyltransferase, chloroplastic isoform X4 [Dendrobium catenatum]|uniref:[Fructose-bisphosphate aldolase]-lysine N-methyltransferase, chloroplastic n=1 Tax=Dendrobium catenatum TaxID=906689 RepID=A0A2I0WGK0_9ASPA|nr:fructose-bisphosphate aldolase-lysine N-methyltransferase, chloroplastic isoform X4 [Dendrobium catenatum]PKU74769.1 [Fructose-bisphosphate aldolase]-lysine N-methyltransferase, chloroplastic [Dendrobium catenatum]